MVFTVLSNKPVPSPPSQSVCVCVRPTPKQRPRPYWPSAILSPRTPGKRAPGQALHHCNTKTLITLLNIGWLKETLITLLNIGGLKNNTIAGALHQLSMTCGQLVPEGQCASETQHSADLHKCRGQHQKQNIQEKQKRKAKMMSWGAMARAVQCKSVYTESCTEYNKMIK